MRLIPALLALLIAFPAAADPAQCTLLLTTAALDISAGAKTTAEFAATPGGLDASSTTPYPTYLRVSVDLVDASNGISNIRLTFTASEITGGTFRSVPMCSDAAPTLTCGNARLDWDPQTYGKAWWSHAKWGFPYGKITVTPTGNGANDTALLTIYGCRD